MVERRFGVQRESDRRTKVLLVTIMNNYKNPCVFLRYFLLHSLTVNEELLERKVAAPV
jgi:hypothetical protein